MKISSPFLASMFLLALLLLCSACGRKYPGFTKSDTGIYYALHKIGESSVKAKYGDYIITDISYQTMKDSVFFKGRRKFKLEKPAVSLSVNECFTMLSQGDSASFIIPANNFFSNTLGKTMPSFIRTNENMKISASIVEIQSEEEYLSEKQAFLKWIEDFSQYEKEILRQFIQGSRISVRPTQSGLYYIKLVKGNGRKVKMGDTLVIDFEGRFLNGRFFDSTVKRNEPFQFVYGQEWQVIKGLEEGVGLMEEGEKALFIVPSELAFGQDGSSTGIIPPYTSLIYEVELKKIK
jgi:FKBP-type peptidyl-prolyl cis-trans isomerase FkpA